MNRKRWFILLLALLVILATGITVSAQIPISTHSDSDEDDSPTGSFFLDCYKACKEVQEVAQADFDNYLSGKFSTSGVLYQKFVYDLRWDVSANCNYVTSTLPPEGLEDYEIPMADSAYEFITSYELRLLAIEKGGDAQILALADEIYNRALDTYNAIPFEKAVVDD